MTCPFSDHTILYNMYIYIYLSLYIYNTYVYYVIGNDFI